MIARKRPLPLHRCISSNDSAGPMDKATIPEERRWMGSRVCCFVAWRCDTGIPRRLRPYRADSGVSATTLLLRAGQNSLVKCNTLCA